MSYIVVYIDTTDCKDRKNITKKAKDKNKEIFLQPNTKVCIMLNFYRDFLRKRTDFSDFYIITCVDSLSYRI